MAQEKICGIYCIENLVNGKKYIGQSVNIADRKIHHFYSLRNGAHYNEFLQEEYDIYGEENFIFYIIDECDDSLLDEHEILYINKFNLLNKEFGYNISPGGAHPHQFSEIELQKRSDSIKEKWRNMDVETRERILSSLQDGYQRWFNNLTAEEKAAKYERMATTVKMKPEEERNIINKKRTEAIKMAVKNRTPEKDAEIRERYRETSKNRWNKTPLEIKEALRQSVIRSVYCPELNMQFESVKAASLYTSVPSSNIVKVCKGDRNYAGKLDDGTKLTWKYA